MKNKIIIKILLVLVLPVLLLMNACTKFDEPAQINDPTITYSASPTITSVNPSGAAAAGVREIEIIGSNFAVNNDDTNWVFVGGSPAKIKSVTSDKITIYRPKLEDTKYGTSVNISVTIPTSLSVANLADFQIESPIQAYGDFSSKSGDLTAFEVDGQENMYVGLRKAIFKFDGLDVTSANLSNDYTAISDIKAHNDGWLYIAGGKTNLMRLDPATWTSEVYVALPAAVSKLDFDANGNIFALTANGICFINTDKVVTSTTQYAGVELKEIRVISGNLYVATTDAVLKHEILDNSGTLGEAVTVVDVKSKPGFAETALNSFTIAADGTILLVILNYTGYSVFVVEGDGSIAPYYQESIIPDNIENVIWGTGKNIYLLRGSQPRDVARVFQMGMNKLGAPYLGR
ncbi:MAG: IPT/TIG domain-containing protein [bacterium]